MPKILKSRTGPLLVLLLAACGCSNESADLERNNFIDEVLQGSIDDGPFWSADSMETVFFSKNLVSVFCEHTHYMGSPHDSKRYEGKTFVRNAKGFRQVTFKDLFRTPEQQEFIRQYCENELREGSVGYFGDGSAGGDRLDVSAIQTFLVHERFLVIVFQRYAVAGVYDHPITVRIPFDALRRHIDPHSGLLPALDEAIASGSYVSSWEKVWGRLDESAPVHEVIHHG